MVQNSLGLEFGSSLFLTVKDIVKIIDLLNGPVTLCRPDHWLMVSLNDLVRKGLRWKRRNFLMFSSWRWRLCRTLLNKRLIALELGTPLHDLSS